MKKSIFLAASALMLGVSAPAVHALDSEGKANYLYINNGGVDPTCVVIGEDNRGQLNVYMDNETDDLNSCMMDFYLPEGFSIAKNSRGGYMVTFYNGDEGKTYNHNASVGANDGFYRMVATSTSATPILTGDDLLFTVTIEADATVLAQGRDKVYDASVKNIEFASKSNTVRPHYFPDMEFTIRFDVTDGVNGIAADASESANEIYDLQGRKLNTIIQPGVYIVNGEKTYVK